MTPRMYQEINGANLIRYACLAFPLAFAGLPIYMLAPDFYSVHLQLSLSTLGIGLLALRITDAFLDPLLGRLIDVLAHRARLISGASWFFLCLGFLMLFCPPRALESYLAAWFFVSVFLVTTAFSALTILYGATGALWSEEKSKQTLITSYREAATLFGLILAISVPFLLLEVLSPRSSYLILILLFVVLLTLCYWFYRPIQTAVLCMAKRTSDKQDTTSASPNASIAFLYVCYGLSALASAVPAVLVVFFVRDYLGSQIFIGIALVTYFLAGALSMPFWHRIAARLGKIRAWQLSMVLAVLSFTWVCLLAPGEYLFYLAICLMSGAALGAEMALPPAILSEYLGGDRGQSAAQKYSGLTMISKLALAISAGVCLPILALAGFEAGAQNEERALMTLLLLYGALPGALKLFALFATQRWIHAEKVRSNYAHTTNFTNTRSMSDV